MSGFIYQCANCGENHWFAARDCTLENRWGRTSLVLPCPKFPPSITVSEIKTQAELWSVLSAGVLVDPDLEEIVRKDVEMLRSVARG